MKITADYDGTILTIRKTTTGTNYMGLVYEIPCKNKKEATKKAKEHVRFLEKMYNLKSSC